MKQLVKKNILCILYIISALLFVLPSYYNVIKYKSFSDNGLEFRFLLMDDHRILQAVMFFIVITLMIVLYLLILKHREKIFDNYKKVFIFIILFSSIFIITNTIFSHDVLYYMGIGRLNSQYWQNPYYVSLKEFVGDESQNIDFSNDEVITNGYNHFWAKTKVVYGPVWTLICAILSKLSFGNANIGLLVYKIASMAIHILNCYILYKISKRKLIILIYGLNPFIIIESIVNVHNDIFMLFFMFLTFYELIKKKSVLKAVIFLGIATCIKYFTIMFLPFIIIYHFRKEKVSKRFLKCIEYGLIFLVIVIIPYLLYFRDFNVLHGIVEQQNKLSKSISIVLFKYGLIQYIAPRYLLIVFAIYYVIKNIKLLFNKEIKLRKEMGQLFIYLFIFTFILITNFQPWYMIWLMSFFVWLEQKKINLIIQITIIALYVYIINMIYDDRWSVGVKYSIILLSSIIVCIIINNLRRYIKRKRINGDLKYENIK